jgi:hypothetical protein
MPYCEYNGCKTESSFNFKGMPRKYCSKHKEEGMLNVKDCICIFENCNKQAYYNYIGFKEKLYCKNHKLENMVDVKNKLCKYEACQKQPLFNYKNEKDAVYCYEHKIADMVDVKHSICIDGNCCSRARYNILGRKPIYCVDHKLNNMIDLDAKKCKYEDCVKNPNFNYFGEKSGIYCGTHKLNNMIDVKNSKCQYNNCNKKPSFNYEGQKELLYCLSHKLDGMINITIKKCKTPLCDTKANPNYEDYCLRCFTYMHPHKRTRKNYKTKEQTVSEYIKENFKDLTIITDKINPNGCSKKRPDILIDLGYQIIIVEIDEKQHKTYDCSCNNKRIMEISQDNEHRPIIFIRFNPDSYKVGENKMSSCWKLSKTGFLIVDKSKELEWKNRLSTLKDQIDYWCNPENITDKTIEIVQLYYDQ